MHVNTHLNFNGNCDAAFKYYEEVLDGKIAFKMTWGESPMANELPAEAHKVVP